MPDITLQPASIHDPKDFRYIRKAVNMAANATHMPQPPNKKLKKGDMDGDYDAYTIRDKHLRVLGAALLSNPPDEPYIYDLAIWKKHQGKGYGKQALQQILDKLTGRGPVTLGVAPDNDRARHIYELAGFKPAGTWKSSGNIIMQKDASMSAEEKKLRRLARPFYPAVGRRSWEHVNQVKQNAEMMTQGLEHRPLTLQEKAAIYFHDCAIRQRGTGKEHGKYGRETAIPLLLSTGIFNDKQLKEIGQAILEHDTLNATGRKFSNRTGEVLASGDANTPDLPWLLNKFYNWQLQNNPDKDTWPADIYETAVEEFGNKSTEKFPALYNKFHGDRVQKLRDQIDSMSQDDMWNMVQKYRRKHHLSELDERLGKPPMFQPA